MISYEIGFHCSQFWELLKDQNKSSFIHFCIEVLELERKIGILEEELATQGKYSDPLVLIGIYISIALLFSVLGIVLDLLYGVRNRKFWFPTKYFSLNAASITVITVAMKLPVDLSSPMPTRVDQVAKLGSLAFMCTMMSNLMPSLASMDNKSLLANVTGLAILVITLIVDTFIQIRTRVISPDFYTSFMIIAFIYMGLLLFLLIILISSSITIPTTKKILEFKHQATSKRTLDDQNPQENQISTVEKLRELVKRYWIMAETGNPQFVMASNPLSAASGIICAISMLMYIYLVWVLNLWPDSVWEYATWRTFLIYKSAYKWSIVVIFVTQSVGIVVGSSAPLFRCFTILSFKTFAKHNRKHFMVFKVEKYWTQKLCEWKESPISFLPSGRRSRSLIYNLRKIILSFCIVLQKVTVVSCKILGLIPIVAIIFVVYCSNHFKSLKAMLFTPSTVASSDDTNEDFSNCVLLLEDNMRLAEKTMKRISNSMNRLIQNAENKRPNNLLKLLEKSVTLDGVETFDTSRIQSLLFVEPVNSWSLPIVSLTCIAIALPNIHKDMVDNLLKSVGEGLSHTHLVEESLNKASEYVNIQRAAMIAWHEVEDKCKWLDNTLGRSAYEGKTPTNIVKSFARIGEEIVNEFNKSMNGEPIEKENLPLNVVVANSMYRIAKTIMHTYESNNLEIVEDELFTRLSVMIADILAACLTNIPRVVIMKCHESAIERREASVMAAVDLLGRTSEMIKRLETRVPSMDEDKMAFIDEWRLHLRQP